MGHKTTEKLYSGQGVCLIAKKDPATGKPLGFRHLGNVSQIAIQHATNVITHKESQSGQRVQDKRLITDLSVNLNMTFETFVPKNLALASRGTTTDVVGATVTDEAVKAYAGAISALEHIKVSSLSITKGVTPLVLYTDGAASNAWDFKLNAEAGSIEFNADGPNMGYVDGVADVLVDYTYAKQVEIQAINAGNEEYVLRFEGLNTAENDEPVVINVHKVQLDPTQEFSLISDTIQGFQLAGACLKDSTKTVGSAFYEVLQTA